MLTKYILVARHKSYADKLEKFVPKGQTNKVNTVKEQIKQ